MDLISELVSQVAMHIKKKGCAYCILMHLVSVCIDDCHASLFYEKVVRLDILMHLASEFT